MSTPDKVFVRVVLAAVALVAVATPVVAGLATQARAEAAEDSRRLASEALALVDQSPDLAGQLAVTAQRIAPSTEAAEALIASTVRQTGDHAGEVRGVAVSSDGTLVVTIGDDGAYVWDAADPRQASLVAQFAPDETALTAVAMSPVSSAGGWLVATAGAEESVQLWRVALGQAAEAVATLAGHDGRVDDLVFSPGGAMLASADAAGTVRLWDLSDEGRPVARAELRHDGGATSATFAPGRDLLVVGTADGLSTWDVSDLDRPVRRDDVRRPGAVEQVVFGPDGRTLIAVVSDGDSGGSGGSGGSADSGGASVQLFRVDEVGRTNHVRNFGDAARGAVGVGYADDARTAVTVRTDGAIALWSLEDPDSPVRREALTAQPDATGVVAVAAGDQRLLAVSAGSSVRLWQLDAAAAAAAVCARVTEPVSEQQWRYYLPDRDFEPPCG